MKINWNNLLSLIILLPAISSCTNGYKIEGTSSVSMLDGRKLYLETLSDGKWVKLDSAEVVHGAFTMKGAVDSTQMVTLFMDETSIMPFVLEKGTIKLDLSDTQMNASGTPLNKAFYEFIDRKNQMDASLADLDNKEARSVLDGANLTDVHEKLKMEADSLSKAMNSCVKTFIIDNYENVLGPTVFMMMCSNLPYPIMTPQIDEIIKDAPDAFKNHKLVKEFLSKAKENMLMIQEQQLLQQNMNKAN